ncbi:MAG: hypothetical protein GWO02_00150 [Gammaproteobacteria bacterium]|nr:hypothetical protein [Gammaproteobacteria bacterium]
MTDVQDLQTRAGHVEQAMCEDSDRHKELLSDIQGRMDIVRDRLIEKKIEVDRLSKENRDLRRLIERLLGAVESKSPVALHDRLKDLDTQLSVLLDLSGDDSAVAASDAPEAAWDPAGGSETRSANARSAESAALAVSAPSGGAASDASGLLSDIHSRVRKLCEQLPQPAGQSAAQPPASQPQAAEPEPIETLVAAAAQSGATALDRAARAAGEETPAPARVHQGERKAVLRASESASRAGRDGRPKIRMHLDAEVDYALSVLRRIKREDQVFSAEEVRDLVNGKFDLGLSAEDDRQVAARLSKRSDLTASPTGGTTRWKFARPA